MSTAHHDAPAPELGTPEETYQAEPGEPSYIRVLVVMVAAGAAALALIHLAGRAGLLQP